MVFVWPLLAARKSMTLNPQWGVCCWLWIIITDSQSQFWEGLIKSGKFHFFQNMHKQWSSFRKNILLSFPLSSGGKGPYPKLEPIWNPSLTNLGKWYLPVKNNTSYPLSSLFPFLQWIQGFSAPSKYLNFKALWRCDVVTLWRCEVVRLAYDVGCNCLMYSDD